ncbi:hypothetical protein MJ904_05150 [Massilia sp. MB5]|uniref:STY0301 family protein n=1 Tax=Massilia sp. MB5 TaxID=2919578 RepID=UPI001F0DB5C0|nr:STY0301 family protein [Massilia sp. MB5]UMR31605.1 hypothetical protein MJ904_05150 [Massilia sp. MB5]
MKTSSLAIFSLAAMALSAKSAELVCPSGLVVRQTAETPTGWTAFDAAAEREHPFHIAEISEGPPQRRILLMPTREIKQGKNKALVYDLGSIRQPWLICSYTDTSLTLSRSLPAHTRRCTFVLDHATNYASVKQMGCE